MGFRQPVTVRRRSGGDYVNGYWAGESETDFTIMASIQPVSGRQRFNVPQGYDSTSSQELITDTELLTTEAQGQRSDIVSWRGDWFVVVNGEPWRNNVINHYRYLIALPDNPAKRT